MLLRFRRPKYSHRLRLHATPYVALPDGLYRIRPGHTSLYKAPASPRRVEAKSGFIAL